MILTHSATIQLSVKCVRPLSQNLWLEKLRTKKSKIILDLFLVLKKKKKKLRIGFQNVRFIYDKNLFKNLKLFLTYF